LSRDNGTDIFGASEIDLDAIGDVRAELFAPRRETVAESALRG
jgi:hypothetical protein